MAPSLSTADPISSLQPGPTVGTNSDVVLFTRLLASVTDTERHIMALLKLILTDSLVHAMLPSGDVRTIHHILASHAVEVNGATCRFPNCDCAIMTCAVSQPPAVSPA